MTIHIALYAWKPGTPIKEITQALYAIEMIANKVPGLLDVVTGENISLYGEGYTHVIVVRGKNQAAIDAYRNHPDHIKAAKIIEAIEEKGIGVDFSIK